MQFPEPRAARVLRSAIASTLLFCNALAGAAEPSAAGGSASADIERGKYLIVISHCNNCHTARYAAVEGTVPESQWLTGNPVGWKGRDGTVYAPNLRLMLNDLTEAQWLTLAREGRARPPMPWWSVRDMNDADLRAVYRYVRSLAPLGSPSPANLPAGEEPTPPFNQLPDISFPRK